MNKIIEKFNKIKLNISKIQKLNPVNIVAISKTFTLDHIKPLIDFGHKHFGENKVQEATSKWKSLKLDQPDLKLHMVGGLQTNKAKNAADLFDYIHSLDRQKLADILSDYEKNSAKSLKYFVQVNIGDETQKYGIPSLEVESFVDYCVREKKLNVIGLMVIPPNDNNTKKYFEFTNKLNKTLGLPELSMGMSSDYEEAVKNDSTFVRIGSSIFGNRS